MASREVFVQRPELVVAEAKSGEVEVAADRADLVNADGHACAPAWVGIRVGRRSCQVQADGGH